MLGADDLRGLAEQRRASRFDDAVPDIYKMLAQLGAGSFLLVPTATVCEHRLPPWSRCTRSMLT